mgnify:CR=1 FL=1
MKVVTRFAALLAHTAVDDDALIHPDTRGVSVVRIPNRQRTPAVWICNLQPLPYGSAASTRKNRLAALVGVCQSASVSLPLPQTV